MIKFTLTARSQFKRSFCCTP